MRLMTLLFLFLSINQNVHSIEFSKIEFAGCPENSFCQKLTGENRQTWLKNLEDFTKNKIDEASLNKKIQSQTGVPIPAWGTAESSITPLISLWDSPCKQHKKEASKYFISEIFVKNLKSIQKNTELVFSQAVGLDALKKPYSFSVLRGDFPLYANGENLYYLREDEGKYYGLLLSESGNLRVVRPNNSAPSAKDAVCLKEQVDHFFREAPSPNFYETYFCKDLWDLKTKKYKTILFGWSCL